MNPDRRSYTPVLSTPELIILPNSLSAFMQSLEYLHPGIIFGNIDGIETVKILFRTEKVDSLILTCATAWYKSPDEKGLMGSAHLGFRYEDGQIVCSGHDPVIDLPTLANYEDPDGAYGYLLQLANEWHHVDQTNTTMLQRLNYTYPGYVEITSL